MRKHLHKNWKPYLYSGLFLHAVGCNTLQTKSEATYSIAKTLTSSREYLNSVRSNLGRISSSVRRKLKYPQLSSIRSEIKNNAKRVFENSNNLDDQHKKELVIQQAQDKLEKYNSLVTNTKYALLSIDINNLTKLSQKCRKQQNQEAKVGSDDTDYYALITKALENLDGNIETFNFLNNPSSINSSNSIETVSFFSGINGHAQPITASEENDNDSIMEGFSPDLGLDDFEEDWIKASNAIEGIEAK